MIKGSYDLDHFLPQVSNDDLSTDYDNLVYSCHTCNLGKNAIVIPDPFKTLVANNVVVFADGTIEGTTIDAKATIRKLDLNADDYCRFRVTWIRIIELAAQEDADLYQRLLTYPDNLPNLATKQPDSNSRPSGVENSFYAKRTAGTLPATYD